MNDIDKKMLDFMNMTAKSKVAIVIPLFGYWSNIKDNTLNKDTFKMTVDRLYSQVHQVYYIFVAEPARTPKDIQSIVTGKIQGGNVIGVDPGKNASYAQYLKEGADVAMNETDSEYILFANPWVLAQHGGIDVLIDRINKADEAKFICGHDVRKSVNPKEFDSFLENAPKEYRGFSFNLAGAQRRFMELFPIDDRYLTHSFVERDMWQTVYKNGLEAISTERVPIFPFDIEWALYEPDVDAYADAEYFKSKWGFLPE